MKISSPTALCCMAALSASLYAQPKALFYMTPDAAAVRSFEEHKDKIDMLVPTWYSISADGLVAGSPDRHVLAASGQTQKFDICLFQSGTTNKKFYMFEILVFDR